MKWIQHSIVALLLAGALSLGLAGPAAAQVTAQDGLVNVNVGNVTILEDVNIAVAARVVATICGVKIGPIAVLGRAVDLGTVAEPVCVVDESDTPITIIQN